MDKPVPLEEQRQIQFDILKAVDRFCMENSIDYSISFGTLIGAVRHHGFIPWDDDIDIMMTRDNYEKFRSLYQSERYPLYDLKNDPTHPVPMGKICDSTTYFYYGESIRRKYGLFIDVFPFDKVPENIEEREKWLKTLKLYIRCNEYKNNTLSYCLSSRSLKVIAFGLFVKLFIGRKFIHQQIEKLYVKYNDSDNKFVSVPAVMVMNDTYRPKIFPEVLFRNYISIDFEGNQFKCIKDYDSFLRIFYGDYMELPPVEKRIGKHYIRAFYK